MDAVVNSVDALFEAFRNHLGYYMQHCPNSIARDAHMNECDGIQPPVQKVEIALRAFLGYCLQHRDWFELHEWTSGKILRSLSDAAISFNNYLPLDKQEQAAIVSFINHIGATAGVDWAMKTSDLG